MAVMNDLERRALQRIMPDIVECLNPKVYVIDVLFSKECLTSLEYEGLLEIPSRPDQCRELLMIVRRKCALSVFVQALSYKDSHTFLAKELQRVLRELKEEERKREEEENKEENDGETREDNEENSDDKRNHMCLVCKCPSRINTMTRKKKLLTKMQQHLKYLCMNGNSSDHSRFLNNLAFKWKGDADVKFVILDAQARDNRISSSDVQEDHGAFRKMESLIPYTTDPTTSSMTFLARKASVFDVKGQVSDGLTLLGYAKNHAMRVVPCRDTGMVIYMEINLLLKEYEGMPSEEKKTIIVERIKEAIDVHFSKEDDDVKEDCSRMLYVKMACFYLGLGLHGNKMQHSCITSDDLRSADCVLGRLEESWKHMDNRRKMFYYLARAVLCQYRGEVEKALHFSEISKQMAVKGKCDREAANIDPLTRDLEIELTRSRDLKGEEILKEFDDLQISGEIVREIPSD